MVNNIQIIQKMIELLIAMQNKIQDIAINILIINNKGDEKIIIEYIQKEKDLADTIKRMIGDQ